VLWTHDLEGEGEGGREEGQKWRMVLQGEEVLVVGDGGKGSAVWLDLLTGRRREGGREGGREEGREGGNTMHTYSLSLIYHLHHR